MRFNEYLIHILKLVNMLNQKILPLGFLHILFIKLCFN